MTVEKPKPKQLLRPITTGAGSAMNQSQFLAITCNSLKAREKSRVHGEIGFGFGFASDWLKNWRESFKPITKRSNRDHVITFDSHLKTALILEEKGKRLQQTAQIPPKPASFSVQPRSSCLLQKGLALQACRLYSRDPGSRFISSKGN